MKYQSYEKMYEVDVWEVKQFLLKVASDYKMSGLEKMILLAKDLEEMHDLIQKSEIYQKRVFITLKKQLDIETDTVKMEQCLVYMKLLLDWEYSFYEDYRHRLMAHLIEMSQTYLTSDVYCLMRHLIQPARSKRRALIESLNITQDETQRYFICEIYLIEEDYQMAYTYLKRCRYEGVLQEYDFELKAYHSLKYRLYAKKQPLFKNLSREVPLWMKSQLKY